MTLLVGAPILIVLLRLLDDAAEAPVHGVVRRMAVVVLCAFVVVVAAALYKLATFSVPGHWTFAQ